MAPGTLDSSRFLNLAQSQLIVIDQTRVALVRLLNLLFQLARSFALTLGLLAALARSCVMAVTSLSFAFPITWLMEYASVPANLLSWKVIYRCAKDQIPFEIAGSHLRVVSRFLLLKTAD